MTAAGRNNAWYRRVAAGTVVVLVVALGWAVPAAAATLTVDDLTDGTDASPGNGLCATARGTCTLRAAVQEANAVAGADVITLPAGTIELSLTDPQDTASTGDIDIANSLTIEGAGREATTVAAGAGFSHRLLDVAGGGTVLLLRHVTLTGGTATGASGSGAEHGGCMNLAAGSATVTAVAVRGCSASGSGGGIHAVGDLELQDVIVADNTAPRGAGVAAVDISADDVAVTDNIANPANGGGGGMYLTGAAALSELYAAGNRVGPDGTGSGGGVRVAGGSTVTVTRSSIWENHVATPGGAGGGLSAEADTVTLTASHFMFNVAAGEGAGIHSDVQESSIYRDLLVEKNTAGTTIEGVVTGGAGGGISALGPTFIDRVTVLGNTAGGSAAALRHGGPARLHAQNLTVVGNLLTRPDGSGKIIELLGTSGDGPHTLSFTTMSRNGFVNGPAETRSTSLGHYDESEMYAAADVEISSSLLAGDGCSGAFIAAAHNVLAPASSSCQPTPLATNSVFDHVPLGTQWAPEGRIGVPDPQRVTAVWHYRPALNSPVIDHGPETCDLEGDAVDIGGLPRPQDGDADGVYKCDAGASEVETPFRLTVQVSGTGDGVVFSQPGEIHCPPTCSELFLPGSEVLLGASSGWESTFTSYSSDGPLTCETPEGSHETYCSVRMTAAGTIGATFTALPRHDLTITTSGPGTVTSTTGGISCPSTCVDDYAEGSTVYLRAVGTDGWTAGELGGCTGASCSVVMNGARVVHATFVPTLTRSVSGSGRLSLDSSLVTCGPGCSGHTLDSRVAVEPEAQAGWRFDHWTGACSGSGECSVLMSEPRSVGAVFVERVGPVATVGDPITVTEGETIVFDESLGTASDADGDSLEFEWSIGSWILYGDPPEVGLIDDGVYEARLEACDSGEGCDESPPLKITVLNAPPKVSAISLAPSARPLRIDTNIAPSSQPGETAKLAVDASGPFDEVWYAWRFSDASPTVNGGPRMVHRYRSLGRHTASVAVRDDDVAVNRRRAVDVMALGTCGEDGTRFNNVNWGQPGQGVTVRTATRAWIHEGGRHSATGFFARPSDRIRLLGNARTAATHDFKYVCHEGHRYLRASIVRDGVRRSYFLRERALVRLLA